MARIAFVQEELRARFGIMILSAVLKSEGHACEVFIKDEGRDIVGQVLRYAPDIVAFSTMTAGINFALAEAKKIKEVSGALIIMGGAHPTFYPEVINEKCLDAICIGEGEYALLELAGCMDKKADFQNIKNLWVKKNRHIYKNDLRPLIDVNALPMFDREIYYDKFKELRESPTKKFLIVRGCPFDCAYCFNHSLKKMYADKGRFVRFMNSDKLIAEMRYVKEKYGAKWIQFNGDTVNINKEWFVDFLDKYKKEIRIAFLCNVRIDKVDEEMVRKMKEAGCDRVDFGIEHGNEQIRNDILKRNMSDRQIIDGGKLFRKYKIRVHAANIVGVPHETADTVMETIRLNRQIKPELARCFVLQPYPKTQIYDYSLQHGFIENGYSFSELGTGFQIGFDGSASDMFLKLQEHKELTNLYYLFNLLVKYKWLDPLGKILIKFPPNRFFLCIHAFPVIWIDMKYSGSFKAKLKALSALFKILIKK